MRAAPRFPSAWTRPPETRAQRFRRIAGDAAALAIGTALWALMLGGLAGLFVLAGAVPGLYGSIPFRPRKFP